MKKVLLLCVMAAAVLSVQSAKAEDFTISFDGGSLGYSGSGVFVGTYNSSEGGYDISSVLSGWVTDPSFGTSAIVGLSSYLGADQILFYPGGPFLTATASPSRLPIASTSISMTPLSAPITLTARCRAIPTKTFPSWPPFQQHPHPRRTASFFLALRLLG